ncbi:MAG: hypothetical protein M1524_04195 [Patescibacteria group bacterium]|nr:hypothetical protein [Patescibacteria group bacterium]
MEFEQNIFKLEQEKKPRYDAALVHAYWISRGAKTISEEEAFRASLRSHFAARAAAVLFEREGIGKIVLCGGRVKGPSYPSSASIMYNLLMHYRIPEDRIMVADEGYGTEGEIYIFSNLGKANNWGRVVDIAFRTHYRSINKFLPEGRQENSGMVVTHRSVEDIINTYDNDQVKKLLKNLGRSIYELDFRVYEIVKALGMKIPGLKERMYSASQKSRTTKDNNLVDGTIARAIDKFNS